MVSKLTILQVPEAHTTPEYTRYYFEPSPMRFRTLTVRTPFLRRDIYEWMLENIGEEDHVMRVLDRAQFVKESVYSRIFDHEYSEAAKLDVSKPKLFELNNPPVDRTRCNWRWVPGEGIGFHDHGHPAVYKLAWF